MTTLERQIEEKAREIRGIYLGIGADAYTGNTIIPEWIDVAKHVLISELRARLNELCKSEKETWTLYTSALDLPRFKYIQSQIKELESI